MDAFHHVTPPPLQTQQKPRVTEAQHNAEKISCSSFYIEIAYSSFTFWRVKQFLQNEHTPDVF